MLMRRGKKQTGMTRQACACSCCWSKGETLTRVCAVGVLPALQLLRGQQSLACWPVETVVSCWLSRGT